MRDFSGYGNALPAIRWPDGQRLAVSFVLNFEEGAEFAISDGDDYNEAVYEVIDRQPTADPCIELPFRIWHARRLLAHRRADRGVRRAIDG